jgi:hypothetical protein
VARIWRKWKIQPHRPGTFKFSTDPELEAKIRDVVGLYLACARTVCDRCKKITSSGCGQHVEEALAGVPPENRCTCR